MLKHALATATLAATAQLAQAVPVTLDFDSNSTGCATGVTLFNAVTVEEGHCHDKNIGDFQYLDVGDALTITARPGTSFDFLGANLLYYWDETFRLPVSDVPVGIDMTDPADILFVNEQWLWQSAVNTLPLISVSGYSGGTLVQSWSDTFMDTESYYASIGMTLPTNQIDVDPRGLPGAPMTGIDRLEISFASQLASASLQSPILIGNAWYTRLPDGGVLVLDDVELNLANTPTPIPVPVPATLLIGGLAMLGAIRRCKPGTSRTPT